jgi:hypothetical protein
MNDRTAGLDDLQDLSAAGHVQGGVALHLFTEGWIGAVVLRAGFKTGKVFAFVFPDDAVEAAGDIGEEAVFAEFGDGCGFLD